MKKVILSFILFLAITLVMGQTVPRQMVILEIGTGTWCQYCPGAAMGADDLIAHGCLVAAVENHNNDAFDNQYSNARNSFYGIGSFPTAVFDGKIKVIGGDHTQSMYNAYLPKYNTRINIPSPIAMAMTITNSGFDYTAVITMTKVADISGTSLKLQFYVTQSHIMVNWQGQNHLNFVDLLMVPDQNGTVVDFTSGDTQVVTLNFSLDPSAPLEDFEFVTFVQQAPDKEILQGIKRAVIDLNVGFTASATNINKDENVSFTNTTTGGYIDAPETYQWFFPGGTPDASTDKDPVVNYWECGAHDVTLIVNRGGQIDTVIKSLYINVGPVAHIVANPGDTVCDFETVTLDATAQNAASYLWSPDGQTTPIITVDTTGFGLGAHTFSVTLTGNDGCVSEDSKTLFFENCTGISEKTDAFSLSVYPNPSNGEFTLVVNAKTSVTADLTITNTLGTVLFCQDNLIISGKVEKNLKPGNLAPGIYFLTVRTGETKAVHKIFIQ